jgi:hypothetical protein
MALPRRTKSQLARGERLQIMLSPAELDAVDDYRFRLRMPSRAAAVRELFRLGLASATLTQDVGNKKSSDFGVLDATDGKREASQSPTHSALNE